MAKTTFVYVTYIRTKPEKLWSALTDLEFMKQYDGTGIQWTGGQVLHHPHHRARTLEFHRDGVRRLAEGDLQPEVTAGDRLHRPAGPYPIESAHSGEE